VIGDVADAVEDLLSGSRRRVPAGPASRGAVMADRGDVESRYYLRLSLLDRPGVLGRIATSLGRRGVSLASVLQKEPGAGGRHVPVVALTHEAKERAMDAALAEIDAMGIVGAPTMRLRILE
jgi:homoserine dehydrogenase